MTGLPPVDITAQIAAHAAAAGLPAEAVDLAARQIAHYVEGTERDPWPVPDLEDVVWAAEAVKAAAPAIVERERQQADTMALGGMQIEIAVAGACRDLGIDYPAPATQMRALRFLYRYGVNVGFTLARRYAPPERSEVMTERESVIALLGHEAARLESAPHPQADPSGAAALRDFADLLTGEPPDGTEGSEAALRADERKAAAREVLSDVLRELRSYTGPGGHVVAGMPFRASLDQLALEKYGVDLDGTERISPS